MDRISLRRELLDRPIVNSHSHHLPDARHGELGLEMLFRNSYVNWCGAQLPAAGEDIRPWLNAVRTRGYFVWLEKALMEIYAIDEPIGAESWAVYDAALRAAHRDGDWHLRLLREHCRYEAILLDAYWSPGSDNGHPDLFKPAYRINSFFYGYDRGAEDHNGNNIQRMHGREIDDIDEYTDFLAEILRGCKRSGIPVLKCALAYDRPLAFGAATKKAAQEALRTGAGIGQFQDYLMDIVCEIAADLRLPLQMHTGLGRMEGSGAMALQPLIARHPKATFVLMHGSYPWLADIAGLAHAYPNVWADICWLPLISTAAARHLLHELIDVCDADRVIWGCDTWTGEESVGARLAFVETLSRVLSERVEDGRMRAADARRYAAAIMRDNAANLLGL